MSGRAGLREGGGNYLKSLKEVGAEKRGEETKILKNGRGKLGQRVGAFKKGVGDGLETLYGLRKW